MRDTRVMGERGFWTVGKSLKQKNGAVLTPNPVFKRTVSYPTREHSSQLYAAANTPKPVPMMQIAKMPIIIQMVLTPFL